MTQTRNAVPLYLYQTGLNEYDGVMIAADGGMTLLGMPFFGPLCFDLGEEAGLAILEAKALDEGRDPETAW